MLKKILLLVTFLMYGSAWSISVPATLYGSRIFLGYTVKAARMLARESFQIKSCTADTVTAVGQDFEGNGPISISVTSKLSLFHTLAQSKRIDFEIVRSLQTDDNVTTLVAPVEKKHLFAALDDILQL